MRKTNLQKMAEGARTVRLYALERNAGNKGMSLSSVWRFESGNGKRVGHAYVLKDAATGAVLHECQTIEQAEAVCSQA